MVVSNAVNYSMTSVTCQNVVPFLVWPPSLETNPNTLFGALA